MLVASLECWMRATPSAQMKVASSLHVLDIQNGHRLLNHPS